MSALLEQLDALSSQIVASHNPPTAESIRAAIDAFRRMELFASVSDGELELLARQLEERIGVSMGVGAVVSDREFRPWLHDARAEGRIDPYYWNRYRKLLASQRLPSDVITSTDAVTDTILDRMGDPTDDSAWARKGMVVGHVQSGKTANYTGLVCKAADAGYRLIVVIAGIHNNLRNQTQGRIDEGFIGRDTGRLEMQETRNRPRLIGVGAFDDRRPPVSLTTTKRDFNKDSFLANTTQLASYAVPVVLVIKKNAHTLANLIEWLKEHSAGQGSQVVEQAMLLIDDEADNASIDTKYGKEEVSRINGQIRNLLGLFRRSCYVGYTATPFANIFIDPDTDDEVHRQDLFPRHFIIGLDAPTNYFGARKVFIDGISDEGANSTHLRNIDDNADVLPIKHKIDQVVATLPESMVEALRTFLIARTIRNIRGQKKQHASMLVNASRFTGVQNILRNRLHEQLGVIQDAVRVDGAMADAAERNSEIAALKATWAREYCVAFPDWPLICANLLPVVAAAEVSAVNSSSSSALDYDSAGENGRTIVAVGGFSLSRGLTLEGLTVSYFLRNSLMYDTLMQMGRWFGYRTGYEDLCRIWMPNEAAGWYAHIAEATEELHEELRQMQQANATPEQFGLAVRSHPSALMVTARNKMGSGQKHVMIGLSNNYIETTRLGMKALATNREARDHILRSLAATGVKPMNSPFDRAGGYLVSGVARTVIEDFLRRFDNSSESPLTDPRPVRRYIQDRSDELDEWDVLITSRKASDGEEPVLIEGWSLLPLRRSVGPDDHLRDVLSISGKRSRVASRGVERAGLSEADALTAEAAYRAKKKVSQADVGNYPDHIYRFARKRPLFILFNLQIKTDGWPAEQADRVAGEPVAGWGISFPPSSRADRKVEYILNTTKLRELFGSDEDDGDEFDDRV